MPSLGIDAVIEGAASGTLSIDALLWAPSSAFTLDGITKRTAVASFAIGAVKAAQTGGLDENVALLSAETDAAPIGAWWSVASLEATFPLGTISWTGSAATIEWSPMVSVLAWTRVTHPSGHFSVDAVLI